MTRASAALNYYTARLHHIAVKLHLLAVTLHQLKALWCIIFQISEPQAPQRPRA